jgi:hypothetical protein
MTIKEKHKQEIYKLLLKNVKYRSRLGFSGERES